MTKEKRVTIRLSHVDFERLKTTAEKYGLTISSYIRKKSGEGESVFRDPEVTHLLREIHSELRTANVTISKNSEKDPGQINRDALKNVYGALQQVENILLHKGGSDGYHKVASN